MGGGLMQLVAYGAQDIYLTGNPQITFFKVVYRRHTNFAMECVEQTFSGSGSNTVATISRNGDLVGKMYVTSTGVKSGEHGTDLVNSAEVEIGGQRIDKQTAEWMQIWNELSTPESKAIGLKAMQGDIGTVGASGVEMLQIPLQFWFNRNPGLALPLIALQYHEVKVKLNLNGDSGYTDKKLWADYIYLDTDERRRFAQVSHEYLIEQVQETTASGNATTKLNFNHPVKELIWASASAYANAKLVLNGHDRFAAQEEEYFQLRQPFDHHTAIPKQNLPSAAQITTLDRQTTLESFPTGVSAVISNVNAAPATAVTAGSETVHMASNVLTIACANNNADALTTKTHKAGLQLAIVPILVGTAADFNLVGTGTAVVGTIFFATLTSDVTPTAAGVLTLPISTPTSANGTPVQLSTIVRGGSTGSSTVQVFAVTNGNSAEARTSQMTKKISVYSFALKPEEHQPSGTCNFSRIDNAQLTTGSNGDDLIATDNIYAVNYNVLRVMSGMGGLAYSN